MEHTKGPWTMSADGIIRAESRTERQAIGLFQGFASEEQHALEHQGNCHLIAAAPELLEQAELFEKGLLYQIKVYKNKGDTEGATLMGVTLEILRDVIKKAKGE